jgi:exonuclease III
MKDLLQTQSLEDLKMVKNLANQSFEQRLETRETLRQSEAREWVKRYRKKIKEEGKAEAYAWWHKTLSDLVKKRGQAAVDDLRKRMNDESSKN